MMPFLSRLIDWIVGRPEPNPKRNDEREQRLRTLKLRVEAIHRVGRRWND